MLQSYTLYLFIFVNLSCNSNATTNGTNNEMSKYNVSTAAIPPLKEDATCIRTERESKINEERIHHYGGVPEFINSTAGVVNETATFTAKATESRLIDHSDTDCPKSAMKRENLLTTTKVPNIKRCPFFKNGAELSLAELIGNWRTVFYKASQIVTCFVIHIRKISFDVRKVVTNGVT